MKPVPQILATFSIVFSLLCFSCSAAEAQRLAPYLPIPACPIPLPTHYHIHYGEPLCLHDDYPDDAADDPDAVADPAARVRDALEGQVARGQASRKAVFL